MPANDDQLWQLLRALDDPQHLEVPANYNHRSARDRFNQLAQRLDTDFGCRCDADREVQDASLHGRIDIPATATATGHPLVVLISNFGGLAVLSVDNPGRWTETETAELLHPDDAHRVGTALANLGYTLIPEQPLWQPYDGASNLTNYPDNQPRSTWWIRYFDYL